MRASQEGDREAMLLAVCSRLAEEREREREREGKDKEANKLAAGGKAGESRAAGQGGEGESKGVNKKEGKQQRAGVIVFR